MLRAAGAKLEPMTLPDFPANAHRLHPQRRSGGGVRRSDAQQEVDCSPRSRRQRVAEHLPHVALHPRGRIHPRAARAHAADRQMDALMSKYDVFLSPTGSASLGITNLTGHPAACLKAGFVDGIPLALMITGRLYDEATVLRVALAYERATKWHTMNPTLDENMRR